MPRLMKQRIVNLPYDDGRKIYTDITFFTYGMNTLIQMKNTVGKSVWVLLSMQPMSPNTKIGKREPKQFFKRPGEHAFILQEWKKDGSDEFFLLGIAMQNKSSVVASDEDADEKPGALDYYMFYSEYKDPECPFALSSLELSRVSGRAFKAAPFDYMRSFARTHKEVRIVEKKSDWIDVVSQFGISQGEIEFAIGANLNESGVIDYFKKKSETVSQLLENVLIPAVERASGSVQAESIQESFIHLAKGYEKSGEKLALSKAYGNFLPELRALESGAGELVVLSGATEDVIADCYAYQTIMEHYEAKFNDSLKECRDANKGLEREFSRIEHEKASYMFYRADEEKHVAISAVDVASKNKAEAEKEYDEAVHRIQVLSAAQAYENLRREQNSLDEIQYELNELAKNTEQSSRLNNLTYSINVAASKEADKQELILSAAKERRSSEKEKKALAEEDLADKRHERASLEKASDKYEGELFALIAINDEKALKVAGGLQRKLDGNYNNKELKDTANNIDKARRSAERRLLDEEAVAEHCLSRLAEIPFEKAANSREKERVLRDIEALGTELDGYRALRERVALYGTEIGCDTLSGRKDVFVRSVREALEENRTRALSLVQSLGIIEEEISAALNGTLHIPSSVKACLEKQAVQYDSCESRLLGLVNSGKMSRADMEGLLAKFPVLAYSIVIYDDNDLKLLREAKGDWVSAVVPVLLQSDMANILNGTFKWDANVLARYEADYFSDPGMFISRLNERMQELKELKQENADARAFLEAIENDVQVFYGFAESYEEDALSRKASLENELQLLCKGMDNLEAERLNCEEEHRRSKEQIKVSSEEIESCQVRSKVLSDLRKGLEREKVLREQIDVARERMSVLDEPIQILEDDIQKLQRSLSELVEVIRQASESRDIARTQAAGTAIFSLPAELIDLPIEVLMRQREAAEAKMTSDKRELVRRREEIKERVHAADINLQKYIQDVSEDEYRGAQFSIEEFRDAEAHVRSCSKDLEAARSEKSKADTALAIAENERQNASAALAEWGGSPLHKAEVGTDFDRRIKENEKERKKNDESIKSYERKLFRVENCLSSVRELVLDLPKNNEYTSSLKITNFNADAKAVAGDLKARMSRSRKEFDDAVRRAERNHQRIRRLFEDVEGLDRLMQRLENQIPDHYARIGTVRAYAKSLESATDRVEQYKQLQDQLLENLRREQDSLVMACLRSGERIADGLKEIAKRTMLSLSDTKRKQIIRINMPAAGAEDEIKKRISEKIDAGVQAYIDDMRRVSSNEGKEKLIIGKYERYVSGRNLLLWYLGHDVGAIQIDAYKLDDANDGRYVPWSNLYVFSGAQEFILYLSLMLAIIGYSRHTYDFENFRDDVSTTIVMDNPFAKVQTPSMVEYMMEVLRRQNTQLIALTAVQDAAVVNPFPVRHTAKLTSLAASDKSIVELESSVNGSADISVIEKGFFRTEQLTLTAD